jgi:hypothetical protein
MRTIGDQIAQLSGKQLLGIWEVVDINQGEFVSTHVILLGQDAIKDV